MASRFGIFTIIACLPRLLPAQPGTIRPPALGFVFDSGAHTLKPIVGIPGAALLEAPLAIGSEPADMAVVSPRQDFALLTVGDSREVRLWQPSAAHVVSIDGALHAPDLMVLSPTGAAAVLYRAGDGIMQVLAGLPGAPRVVREIPFPTASALTATVAVADDGQVVLAALDNHAVLIAADGIPRPLPLDGPVSAMAFRPGTEDAIVAGAANQVWLVSNVADAPEMQLLAGPDDGIAGPLAAEFSLDGRRAFVAVSAGILVQLDPAGAPPQSFACQCAISGLHRLAGSSVFRLTDPAGGPIMIFDGDAPQPRILFVPAATDGGADAAQ